MEQREIRNLLEQVKYSKISIEDAINKLKLEPFEDLEFAKLDSHRGIRQGVSEVIYGAGKTPEQIIKIIRQLSKNQNNVLITRLSGDSAKIIQKNFQ